MEFGLIGEKLAHSYSPFIHQQFADYDYRLVEISPAMVGDFLRARKFRGLNVTIPYKKIAVEYCDKLTPIAQRIGAVNTLFFDDENNLCGDNTDYFGFAQMLKHANITPAQKKVILLGSGGTSLTAQGVLNDLGAREIIIVSRSGAVNYENMYSHNDVQIIVNTTPIGMYPNNAQIPLSLENFPQLHSVIDVIYNPQKTRLILSAQEKNILTSSGLMMLTAQAARAVENFTRRKISDEQILDAWKKVSAQMLNIVLIGMPGCGKSTVGKILGKQLNREFIDTDILIVEHAGKSIAQIFADDGENVFRELESKVIAEVSKQSGKIIATGGGAILRNENRRALQQNSHIIYLQRDVEKLASNDRPLSGDIHTREKLFAERELLYRQIADLIVDNNGNIDKTITGVTL